MNKKRIIIFSILAILAVGMIVTSLFLPAVHLIAKDSGKVVVYDKTISLIDYFRDAPFLSTAADEIYFQSSGPVWMATGSLIFLTLPALLGIIMFVLSVLEICLCKTENVNIKNNVLAKKFTIFVGATTLICAVFAIISFAVTTMMANGYMEFGLVYGPFVLATIGLASMILAIVSCRRKREQQTSKVKNSVGFGLVAFFALICVIIPFLPFYREYFLVPDAVSMWQVAGKATELQSDAYIVKMLGDLPFGIAQWAIIALLLVCAFVFVYAFIGFIRSLMGKTTNWLSSRVKRWSMTLAVVFVVLMFLVSCQLGVITSTLVYFDGVKNVFMLSAICIMYIMIPFIPYILSTMISFNKELQPQTYQELKNKTKQ